MALKVQRKIKVWLFLRRIGFAFLWSLSLYVLLVLNWITLYVAFIFPDTTDTKLNQSAATSIAITTVALSAFRLFCSLGSISLTKQVRCSLFWTPFFILNSILAVVDTVVTVVWFSLCRNGNVCSKELSDHYLFATLILRVFELLVMGPIQQDFDNFTSFLVVDNARRGRMNSSFDKSLEWVKKQLQGGNDVLTRRASQPVLEANNVEEEGVVATVEIVSCIDRLFPEHGSQKVLAQRRAMYRALEFTLPSDYLQIDDAIADFYVLPPREWLQFIANCQTELMEAKSGMSSIVQLDVSSAISKLVESIADARRPVDMQNLYGVSSTVISVFRHGYKAGLQLHFALMSLNAIVAGALVPLNSYLTGQMTTRGTAADVQGVGVLAIAYACSWVVQSLLYVHSSHEYSVFESRILVSVSKRLVDRVLYADTFTSIPEGDAVAIFGADFTKLQNLVSACIYNLCVPFMQLLISTIFVLSTNAAYGILLIVMFIFFFLHGPKVTPMLKSRAYSKKQKDAQVDFANGVRGQKLIFVLDAQKEWIERYDKKRLVELKQACYSNYLWSALTQSFLSSSITFMLTFNTIVLSLMLADGSLGLDMYVTYTSLFASLVSPASSLGSFVRNALSGAGSAARIDEALARPPILIDRGDDMSTLNVPGSTASMGDTLEDALLDINHLTFTYPGAKQPALNDVTFSVKQGEFVNIVGPSGCGKSTMLSLLMTIAPTTLLQSGTIRYKGVDLRKMSPLEYRKKIAVVFQESFILNGSILENIAFGAGIPITEDDARQAAMLAGCSFLDDTAILPQGLHTHIGATGKSLSGGQQQRICIARALCKRPEILLLDECTSSLDPRTEAEFWETIRNVMLVETSLTVISVTHHVDFIAHGQRVLTLGDGRVVSYE